MHSGKSISLKVMCLIIIILGLNIPAGMCFAVEKGPALWEFGIFGATARIPHYRGSDEHKIYALPLPYFLYRGKIIQMERDGIRGVFFKHPNLEVDISLFGNPPVEGDNDARIGMPECADLDPIYPCRIIPPL